MIIEVYRDTARKYGTENAIKKGYFSIWTAKRIKGAFNYGKGTAKDFKRFMNDNKMFCIFLSIPEKDLSKLYPEYTTTPF